MTQPQRTLVGSLFGKSILLITPLLKWYMEHGLKVKNIKQVIEYKPNACFYDFGDSVTKARRQADLNPDSSILGEAYKLLGNSAYGKTLEDLSRHREIHYVKDGGAKLINDQFFRKLTPLDEEVDEIEMAKKAVSWYLPLQIGFFVYQYAKLRMLEFYYDCLAHFIDKSNFQLCQMDTDSLYFVIAGKSIDDVIKPDLKQ